MALERRYILGVLGLDRSMTNSDKVRAAQNTITFICDALGSFGLLYPMTKKDIALSILFGLEDFNLMCQDFTVVIRSTAEESDIILQAQATCLKNELALNLVGRQMTVMSKAMILAKIIRPTQVVDFSDEEREIILDWSDRVGE